MSLRARLQRWWDKVLGRPPWYRDTDVTISRTDLYADKAPPARPSADPGGLTLADDEQDGRGRTRSHRSAGVDPYANDAGFAKPKGWKNQDRD
jgi:hypothetical protein